MSNEVVSWVKNKKNFLIFLGAPGVGKTYFCSALIPWIDGKFANYRYWNERDLLSRVRSEMGSDRGDYLKTVNYLIDDDFVIIDDLGSSGFTEWRTEVLFDAIDSRYESQKPTVITSNLTRLELAEGLGQRGASRLFASENLIIEMHDMPDRRQDERSDKS